MNANAPANEEVVAGIDLGSNSFHMIVVRSEADGRVHILDKIKETVRLAAGLNEHGMLDEDAIGRGTVTLERFAQRLSKFPSTRVRAVGTNTLRKAKNGPEFVQLAEKALGHPIDIISGPEEARLVYLGVAHSNYFDGRRLVMDIGGGSTEMIIGDGFTPIERHSLFMGCVSFSDQFFPQGKISEKHFRRAVWAAQRELRTIEPSFKELGWLRATGSSGTLKAIDDVMRAHGFSQGGITPEGLSLLEAKLMEQRSMDKIQLSGLDPDRAQVFPGGVAITRAAFEILGITSMEASEGALREGVVYELLDRKTHGDIRDETALTFARRYKVNIEHAQRVEATALSLFEQLERPWRMPEHRSRKSLHWICLLHEIGLSIAYSGHHRHAAYLVENADMPGFSREQQAMLAAVFKNQRRALKPKRFDNLAPDRKTLAPKLTVIIRLAILFHRARAEVPPIRVVEADRKTLRIRLPHGWLAQHPLTEGDLEEEAEYLRKIDLKLRYE